ncbi:MAG: carboxypeptidase-like regulatory domain-containing protein [Gemmataceae bacterium]
MRMRLSVAAVGLLAVGLAGGCGGGGPKLARVTGVVTLDGKPYPNAVVSFQPMGGKDNPNPGAGSMGVTDEAGRFELMYENTSRGAVVGRHRVRISTQPGKGTKDDPAYASGSPDGEVQPKGAKPNFEYDPIPLEWNEKSEKTFDVPPEGTDKANFDIVSPPKKAAKGGKR